MTRRRGHNGREDSPRTGGVRGATLVWGALPMRNAAVLLPLAVLAVALTDVCRAEEQKADADQIARLVTQLGSTRYADREEATRALGVLGAAALDALRQAAVGKDAEVRRRAQGLIRQIEGRRAMAQALV